MDNTLSLSKGCFVFNNKPVMKLKSKPIPKKILCSEPWYLSFRSIWNHIEQKLENYQRDTFSEILDAIIEYVNTSYEENAILPTAALLTGINMPDHGALFSSLVERLHRHVTPHVAVLQSEKCGSTQSTVTQMASQFMNAAESEDEDSDENIVGKIKKCHCNFPVLLTWYSQYQPSPCKKRKSSHNGKLVIIIPEFESFSSSVLQDFVLILSGYTKVLPLVLILGVATTGATLQQSLPYHVSARMNIQVFQAPPSVKLLNQVLEKVVFDPENPFHLGGKTFNFLMDIFLFYDFSVKDFIQGYKFCMMEHFYGQNCKMLCCLSSELKKTIASLSKRDVAQLRKMPFVQKYRKKLEKLEEQTTFDTNDAYFKEMLQRLLMELREHLHVFYTAVKCLHSLICDLPRSPLGTQIRELYALAVSKPVVCSPEFRESFQLLGFQSREELLGKLDAVECQLDCQTGPQPRLLKVFRETLAKYRHQIQTVDTEMPSFQQNKLDVSPSGKMNRYQLKEKLLRLSKQEKPPSKFELVRKSLLDYLSGDAFPQLLQPPTTLPLAEVLFFDNLSTVRAHIVGTPRAVIHTALNDPHIYLECKCCRMTQESSVLPSMPDVSIAYKLYLESGRFINLYDWLQAFVAVVHPDDGSKIDPHLQARFTQAVAELQFLGFVKSSSRKTDHVTKLTFS